MYHDDIQDILFFILFILIILFYQLNQLFYNKNQNKNKSKESSSYNILIISHPDDEIMFFIPLLKNISINKIICLSNGNYYNQGHIREGEFIKVMKYLNIKSYKIYNLNDQPDYLWNSKKIHQIISNEIITNNEQQINLYTFDQYGISGHKNHISIPLALNQYKCKLNKNTNLSINYC